MGRLYFSSILLHLFVRHALSTDSTSSGGSVSERSYITTRLGRIDLLGELGKGSFGLVRKCVFQGRDCAIKMELYEEEEDSTLAMEEKCYKALGRHPGLPKMLYFGEFNEGKGNILVLELVGPSLMDILEQKQLDVFSLKTVLLLGIQILYRMEYIHSRGILFMDHKPENWAMGGRPWTDSLLYILDFGLSEFYIEGGQHVREEPEEIDGAAAGTLRYISIYAHRHKVISRRDDIESIGYVLIYMLRGNVAWASRTGDVKNGKSERIRKIKTETSLVDLVGKRNPKQLRQFIRYARTMSFYQKPNYNYLRRLLRDALANMPAEEDNIFDWSEPIRPIRLTQNDREAYFPISPKPLRAKL